jgi:hypothetical protein
MSNDVVRRSVNCNNCIRIKKENDKLKQQLSKVGEDLFDELSITSYCKVCAALVSADCGVDGRIKCSYCEQLIGSLSLYE